jgi:hypothetical protein
MIYTVYSLWISSQTFRWDDHDDVWFVLDQYAKLHYLSTGLLKQMSMSTRHVAPLGHIILNWC